MCQEYNSLISVYNIKRAVKNQSISQSIKRYNIDGIYPPPPQDHFKKSLSSAKDVIAPSAFIVKECVLRNKTEITMEC